MQIAVSENSCGDGRLAWTRIDWPGIILTKTLAKFNSHFSPPQSTPTRAPQLQSCCSLQNRRKTRLACTTTPYNQRDPRLAAGRKRFRLNGSNELAPQISTHPTSHRQERPNCNMVTAYKNAGKHAEHVRQRRTANEIRDGRPARIGSDLIQNTAPDSAPAIARRCTHVTIAQLPLPLSRPSPRPSYSPPPSRRTQLPYPS